MPINNGSAYSVNITGQLWWALCTGVTNCPLGWHFCNRTQCRNITREFSKDGSYLAALHDILTSFEFTTAAAGVPESHSGIPFL